MRPRWRASFVVAFLCGTTAAAQTTAPLDAYLPIVEQFASGDADGADAALSTWNLADEQNAVDALIRDRPAPARDPGGEYRKRLEAASLIEFDLAFHAVLLPGQIGSATRLEFSRRLVNALNAWPIEAIEPFERRWYFAAATGFIQAGELELAWREIRTALRGFPSDARLHLAAGIVAETANAAGIRDLVLNGTTPLREYRLVYRTTDRKIRLPDPATEYRKALDLDPGIVEARLRLGRVLALKGDVAGAASALTQAAAAATDTDVRYLAHLFLARARANAGDAAAAEHEYQAARETHPQWPTAYIGLSDLAARRGDASSAHGYLEAAETLEHQLDLGDGGTDDPWWGYWPGGRRDFEDAWQWLQQAVAP